MKKTFISFIISLLFAQVFAQNAKVIDTPTGTVISNAGGTDIPYSASILDIRSSNKGVLLPRMSTGSRDAIASPQAGLLLFNSTTNQFDFHNGTAWQQLYLGNQWGINGPTLHHSGSVGIGTTSMLNFNTFLTVRGNLGGTNYEGMYIDASASTGKPFYGYATGGAAKAFHYFDGSTNKWHLFNGGDRITVTAFGDVGIGVVSPGYKLEVNGDALINTKLWVNGGFDVDGTSDFASNVNMQDNLTVGTNITVGNNITVDNNILVNGNKGIVRSDNATQRAIAYAITPANLNITLSPGELSGGFTFAFGETFTSAPAIAWGPMTGMTNPGNIIMVVESIGVSSAVVRYKNVGSTTSVATNATISAMIIGNK